MKWRVSSPDRSSWTVESPTGARWAGLPSQRAGIELARSLAGIESMLAGLSRPALTLVQAFKPPRQCSKSYGFGPVQPTGGRHAHH